MHEEDKLQEADHHLSAMRSSVDDPKVFRFELSAFLSASRTVLQYAHKDAQAKAGGQAWYDARVNGSAVMRFLREKRNIDIHERPIVPVTNANVFVSETVGFSEIVTVQKFDVDGKFIEESTSQIPPSRPIEPQPATISYHYTFPDWSGAEDVVDLCEVYIDALRATVTDGIAKSFLTKSS
jgi:hypothetical protein